MGSTSESTPRPRTYFDILFCLNVIDRHPNPPNIINCLRNLLKKQGILFLASPLDWDNDITPPSFWVDDLKKCLENTKWEIIDRKDFEYGFRYSARKKINFVSQVICARRKYGVCYFNLISIRQTVDRIFVNKTQV